jgi:CRP/FNR family cyclic AMP-dependent transcriptional regulator
MAGRTLQDALLQFMSCVPEPLRTQVKNRLSTLERSKGRTLVEKGLLSTDVFFLRDGRAEVVLYGAGGREVCVHNVHPGDMFGEIAVLDGKPRSASVQALSNIVLDVMRGHDFIACLESSPAAGIWLARRFATSLRRSTEKVFELSALNVQTRIQCELLRLAEEGTPCSEGIEVRPAPTHEALAKRIGTHREAVTKELGALSKAKIIRYERGRLVIIDLPALERAVRRDAAPC